MAAYRRVDDLRSPACTPGSAPGPTLGYGKAFSLYVGLWLVLGLELRVGYSYRVWEECPYTRTDGKNGYGLSILYKQQGMSQQQLSVIAHSIIVSRILYALPAWGGFLSVELKNKINAFFQAP